MAITRERKEELVSIYTQLLQGTDGFIVTEYRGLTVAKLFDLRNKLREVSGTYAITKNTLFTIALRENGWVVPESLLMGPVAIAFGNGNLPAVAKVVQGFIKDNADVFIVKGGIIANSVFYAGDLEKITSLPTMEEIRAQLAGLIVQPASQLAGILQAATSQVVNVVQAYLDKMEAPADGATAEEVAVEAAPVEVA
ncbi:MAG: 50S ribosomal protein L10 [Chloroflexota bacterium]|nr:50S ribosomal protein L10 [Chloroflexota bacterium]